MPVGTATILVLYSGCKSYTCTRAHVAINMVAAHATSGLHHTATLGASRIDEASSYGHVPNS